MKKLSHLPSHQSRQRKALESVSAEQLLKALHTLQNINMIHEQIDSDLNISFSQKDNFNNNLDSNNQVQEFSQTENDFEQHNDGHSPSSSNKRNTLKSKSHRKNTSNKQNTPQGLMKPHGGKMNFEFYMTKKESSNVNIKNRSSRSPRPSQSINQQNHQFKKTFENGENKNALQIRKTCQKKIDNMKINKSVSPLTERSMNMTASNLMKTNNSIFVGKQLRQKTQASEKQSIQQKRKTKTSSILIGKKQDLNKKPLKQNKLPLQNPHAFPSSRTAQSHPSIHQRNIQFMKQKNEKLARLCQEMQQRKKQEEKQCTFKPKILTNNSNIKSKYNDLCASREFNADRTHKQCKVVGKQNISQGENQFLCEPGSKGARIMGKTQKIVEQVQSVFKQSHQTNNDQHSVNQQDTLNSTRVTKPKYKNSKFNILLDLIN